MLLLMCGLHEETSLHTFWFHACFHLAWMFYRLVTCASKPAGQPPCPQLKTADTQPGFVAELPATKQETRPSTELRENSQHLVHRAAALGDRMHMVDRAC